MIVRASGGRCPSAAAASTSWPYFAARSVPSDATGATGDWHDVLALPMGDMAMVVGDSSGRGAKASPLKEALQPALRRLALGGAPPGGILARLRAGLRKTDAGLATVVYVVVAPRRREVGYVSAGHPPPLLVGSDGSARFLGGSLGPPLGAPWASSEPSLGRHRLRPGDTLVLYTDGLIESPERDVETGLRRLAGLARRWAGAPLDEVCARLVGLGLDRDGPPDDLTALAVRWGQAEPGSCSVKASGRATTPKGK